MAVVCYLLFLALDDLISLALKKAQTFPMIAMHCDHNVSNIWSFCIMDADADEFQLHLATPECSFLVGYWNIYAGVINTIT